MKKLHLFSLFVIAFLPKLVWSQNLITEGHYDFSITYEPDAGGWDAVILDYDNNILILPEDLIIGIADEGKTVIPEGEPWGLVGPAGDPVWVFPEIFNADLVYLGFGTQRMQRGIFTGGLSNRGRINIRLVSVTGSGADAGGTLTMWQAGFPPIVHYATGNGIGPEDALRDVPAGAHSHYNWAFTQPGDYFVTFEVSGELTSTYGGGFTSTEVTYQFRVLGDAADPFPALFLGSDLGGGWRWNEQVGSLNTSGYPWVYVQTQGWWYSSEGDDGSAFIWDSQLGWLWSNTLVYPYLYSFEQQNWLFFSNQSDGVRWFLPTDGQWFSEPLS